jgi:hypothetical protein
MSYGNPKNETMSNKSNDPNSMDLEWLAFQYFTAELPDDARLQFEDRLENDQLAREALARAVELTQVVVAVESAPSDAAVNNPACVPFTMMGTPVVPQNRASAAWMAPTAWLAIAGLVCVAAVLFWNPGTPSPNVIPGSQPVTSNGDSAFDSGELASLWVETGEILVTTPLVSEDEPVDGLLLDDEQLEPQSEPDIRSELDADRLQAPSWMMAALSSFTNVEEERHEN